MKTVDVDLRSEFAGRLPDYPARLSAYLLDEMDGQKTQRKDVVLVIPGGGYGGVSDREAEPIAFAFSGKGFSAFILRYATAQDSACFPVQLLQAAAAISFIKAHADEFNINPDRISVCGFSAGGHLAGTIGTLFASKYVKDVFPGENLRPYKLILSYGVLTSGEFGHTVTIKNVTGGDESLLDIVSPAKQIGADTPPAFIWHTADDGVVDVRNSLSFAAGLTEHKVPYELHVYPKGPHGISLANEAASMGWEPSIDRVIEHWLDKAVDFLRKDI